MLGNIAVAVREMSKDNPSPDIVEGKTKEFLSALQVMKYLSMANEMLVLISL